MERPPVVIAPVTCTAAQPPAALSTPTYKRHTYIYIHTYSDSDCDGDAIEV